MRLEETVAIVTGGGGGLGEGIALCFAREGADVVVSDINMGLAEKVVEKVRAAGCNALAIQTDVRSLEQVQEMERKTVNEMGTVDILACSHGVSGMTHREHDPDEPIALEGITEEDWDLTLDLNLKGVFLCNRAVAPLFKERNAGKIINVSSVGGRKGSPQLFAYSISKAGVITLNQALALQLAPHNVNVNSICPGIVYTPMWDQGAKLLKDMDPRFKNLGMTAKDKLDFMVQMTIPFQRYQSAEDIGNAAVFLASDEAKEITGQAINVCGGMQMNWDWRPHETGGPKTEKRKEKESEMIKRIHHAGVGVRDPEMMEKMLHFYRDLLGLSVHNEKEYPEGEFVDSFVDVKDAKLKVVHLICPGADDWWDGGVELCYYASPEPQEWRGGVRQFEGGVVHLALAVENLMEMYERLVEEGVRFNTPLLNLGQGIIAYMRDPDGNTVELMERIESHT